MRLTRIEFEGFKRLADTGCNVDGKLIAFLGPNESGKSSILEGLSWLSESDERLPEYMRTRNANIADTVEVVVARFALSQEEISLLVDIDSDVLPKEFAITRNAAGTILTGAYPEAKRPARLFESARTALAESAKFVEDYLGDNDENIDLAKAIGQIQAILADPDSFSSSDRDTIDNFLTSFTKLSEVEELSTESDTKSASANRLAYHIRNIKEAVPQALSSLTKPHPDTEVRKRLKAIAPDFILFSEQDRALNTNYELANDELRANPPRALSNLLKIAGITVDQIFQTISTGDTTKNKSMLKAANKRLAENLEQYWQQRKLSLTIDTDATTLQVLIDENDDSGTVTAIHERSDGLRIFVALLCFLAVQKTQRPTILLIDEAETHLHIDAQADLITMLTNQTIAQQVIYTTHSPACLPADLGSSVRLVEPVKDRPGISKLKNNFWQDSSYGFAPLLFAMGAGAAAFSVCRKAVLCEGPSEMILLPTLIRNANGVDHLDYQVAPGLSVVTKGELEAASIASQVVYLVDGDAGGASIKKLLTESGVDKRDILSLDSGFGLEDLIDETQYIRIVGELLDDSGYQGPKPEADSLRGDFPVAKNLQDWAKQVGARLPSKVAVASRLVATFKDEYLSTDARKVLRRLHKQITSRLDKTEAPSAT